MNAPSLRLAIATVGSGTWTIVQRLARQHCAAYLDTDAMSARFVEATLVLGGYDPGDGEGNPFYRDGILPLKYDPLRGLERDQASSIPAGSEGQGRHRARWAARCSST